MKSVYKYDPEDYKDVLNMFDDLSNFYRLLEEYNEKKTKSSRLFLEKHSRDLFFTIKHRELEGNITHMVAEEIRGYMRDLLDD